MMAPIFPSYLVIGLAFFDTEIHAAVTRGTVAKGEIKKTIIEKLPEGAVLKGVFADKEKTVKVLQKIRKAMGASSVSVSLPPENVYCVHFTVPSQRGKSFRLCLEAAMARHIPEDPSLLRYRVKNLGSVEGVREVGVIAVRKDILSGLNDVCRQAGLKLKAVTSLALALGDGRSSVMVTAGNSFKPTLTLFRKGWPLDEAVLSENASTAVIADELKDFVQEQQSSYPVSTVRVSGDAALLKSIQVLFPSKAPSGNGKQLPSPVAVKTLLAWVKEKERPLLGAIAASLAGSGGFNLLNRERRRSLVVLALILVTTACVVVTAYLRPDLLPSF